MFSSSGWLLLRRLFWGAEIHLHGGVPPSFWFWFLSGYTFSGQHHVSRLTSTVSTLLRFCVFYRPALEKPVEKETKIARPKSTTKTQIIQMLDTNRLLMFFEEIILKVKGSLLEEKIFFFQVEISSRGFLLHGYCLQKQGVPQLVSIRVVPNPHFTITRLKETSDLYSLRIRTELNHVDKFPSKEYLLLLHASDIPLTSFISLLAWMQKSFNFSSSPNTTTHSQFHNACRKWFSNKQPSWNALRFFSVVLHTQLKV